MQTTTSIQGEARAVRPPSGSLMRASPRLPGRAPQSAQHTNVGQLERVVSSVLGGALMLSALRKPSPASAALAIGAGALLHRGIGGHCYVYQALGRNTASAAPRDLTAAQRSITIEKPAAELYRAWKNPQQLSAMLGDIAQVESLGGTRMRWRLDAPGAQTHSWITQIYEDTPDQRIAWRAEDGSHQGFVSFRPAPRDFGTEVTLSLGFGALSSSLFRKLTQAAEGRVLRRFKSLAVAGEIPTLDKNPSARA